MSFASLQDYLALLLLVNMCHASNQDAKIQILKVMTIMTTLITFFLEYCTQLSEIVRVL